MKLKIIYLLSTVLFLTVAEGFSQGCSDAGFCTMGAMKPDQPFSRKVNLKVRSLDISYYNARTRYDTQILAYIVDVNIGINEKMTAQFKVPYMQIHGKLGENAGIGDLSLSLTRNLIARENFQLNATIGGKIPLNKTDHAFEEEGERDRQQPMYYQTSLGTYDLILGSSVINRDWLFATGIQIPFGRIDNGFHVGEWEDHPADYKREYGAKYPISNKLKRGTDVMLRAERNFRFAKFNFNIGLLSIYRLNKDIVEDPETGKDFKVNGSSGLVLNALAGAGYHINTKHSIKFIYAHRLIEREHNPDGLSRVSVMNIGYHLNF